jgi:hypothetical protein
LLKPRRGKIMFHSDSIATYTSDRRAVSYC